MRRILEVVLLGFGLTQGATAELTASDRAVIKEMTRGSLYLRNNVPCRYTSGIGVGAEVVTEVSPTGVDWDKNLKTIEGNRKNRLGRRASVDTIFWGFGPNDVIRYGKLYFRGGGVVELWAEGVKPKDVEIWIRFVGIDTRDDFKKAYDLILSPKPLQDEHPEWPLEIRTAIGERRVVEGMTKTQAFAVVGTPVGIETSEEAGKKIETWFPRQDSGTSGDSGFMGSAKVYSASTGFPISLRFEDGRLAVIGQSAKSVKPVLDK
ncbi:MAG: hypothetical protein ABSF25_23845 [Bryobacteraceae bacterium]|jgi:hypothetical protein